MNKTYLAKFIHDKYEELSMKYNWKTQKQCKVKFEELPKENKKVMLELSEILINYFSNNE